MKLTTKILETLVEEAISGKKSLELRELAIEAIKKVDELQRIVNKMDQAVHDDKNVSASGVIDDLFLKIHAVRVFLEKI